MIPNLDRYTKLQHLLDQDEVSTIERDLAIIEEIHKLETEALQQGMIYVADDQGGWKLDQLTQEQQAAFLAMEQ